MSRGYQIGWKVKVSRQTQALNSYGQNLGDDIDQGAVGYITGYNDRYTSQIEDDYVKVKIVEGDDDYKNKEVWIKSADFVQVTRTY